MGDRLKGKVTLITGAGMGMGREGAQARRSSPAVIPFERSPSRFTEPLPNWVAEGDSLYRPKAVRREVMA